MKITVTGVKPYDGSYQLRFADELTTREYGWIKRLSGYLPLDIDKALDGGDAEFFCVLAAIAMRRAGKIDSDDVPDVFERLTDAPAAAIELHVDDTDRESEDDAGPPARSSSGSESSSGDGSTTSSETSPETRPGSGIPASDSSTSIPLKSVS